jgi:hypothetical protein
MLIWQATLKRKPGHGRQVNIVRGYPDAVRQRVYSSLEVEECRPFHWCD